MRYGVVPFPSWNVESQGENLEKGAREVDIVYVAVSRRHGAIDGTAEGAAEIDEIVSNETSVVFRHIGVERIAEIGIVVLNP